MINDGRVVGAWFGDQRVLNDGIGGQSQMVRLGWDGPVWRTLRAALPHVAEPGLRSEYRTSASGPDARLLATLE